MKKIRPATLLAFFQSLQALLSAGISLTQALTLQKSQHSSLNQPLGEVIRALREGQGFTEALLAQLALSPLLASTLRLGENSGQLAKACGLCVASLERQASWKRLIWQLSFYPSLLLLTSVVLLGVMIGFVLPEFASLYQTLNVPLPKSTAWLLGLSEQLRQALLPLLVFLFSLILIIKLLWQRDLPRIRLEMFLLKLPGIKSILSHHAEFQLAFQGGSLLQAGCPLIEALDFIRLGTPSPVFRAYLSMTAQRIRQGENLEQSFCHGLVCSPSFTALLSHAQQTGDLESVLLMLANQQTELFIRWQENLKQIIQPCLTLVMGGFLGLWILLLYYPMLQLGTNLG